MGVCKVFVINVGNISNGANEFILFLIGVNDVAIFFPAKKTEFNVCQRAYALIGGA